MVFASQATGQKNESAREQKKNQGCAECAHEFRLGLVFRRKIKDIKGQRFKFRPQSGRKPGIGYNAGEHNYGGIFSAAPESQDDAA